MASFNPTPIIILTAVNLGFVIMALVQIQNLEKRLLNMPKGPEGPRGPMGPEGPKGDDGWSIIDIKTFVDTSPIVPRTVFTLSNGRGRKEITLNGAYITDEELLRLRLEAAGREDLKKEETANVEEGQ